MNSFQAALDPLAGPREPRDRRRNPIWRFRRGFFILGLLGVLGVGTILHVFSQTDLPTDDFASIAQTTYVCTAEVATDCGQDNATAMLSTNGQDREIVEYEQISTNLINAVVATEDQDFWTHRGFDEQGMLRAVYRYARNEGVTQGASTITQQYVKLAFNDDDRNLARKGREIVRAIKLEQELTEQCAQDPDYADVEPKQCAKQEILTRYLNRAYFGRGASGVQSAARVYFDKDAIDLTIDESAFLAGLLRAPERAEPETNPDEANRRRGVSIDLMLDQGYITAEEAAAAHATPLVVIPDVTREGLGDVKGREWGSEYFVEEVRQQLSDLYPNGEIYTNGLRVYTTLDQNLQAAAYRAAHMPKEGEDLAARGLEQLGPTFFDPNNPNDPSAALVSLDAQGRVVAMLGGANYEASQFNLATSSGGRGRQPGSTFKALALATAIKQGISAESDYPAKPGVLEIGDRCADADGGPWRVSGGASSESQKRTLIDALTWSSNIVFAELVVDITPEALAQTAYDMGVTSPLESADGTIPCSTVLGSQGVPVIQMASVFSTFERAGVRIDPALIERVENADGEVICWYPVNGQCSASSERQGQQVLDPDVARQTNYVMTQVAARGTGRRAPWDPNRPIAGKTGTSQQHRDAWFAGFSCDITTVVWVGNADETEMIDFRRPKDDGTLGFDVDAEGDPIDNRGWPNVEGGNFPTWIWKAFMAEATADDPPCEGLEISDDFTGEKAEVETNTTLPPCGVETDDSGRPLLSPEQIRALNPDPPQPDGGGGDGDGGPEGLTMQEPGDCMPLEQYLRMYFPEYLPTTPQETTTTSEAPEETSTTPTQSTTTPTTLDTTTSSSTTSSTPGGPTSDPDNSTPPNGGGGGRGGGGGGGGGGGSG